MTYWIALFWLAPALAWAAPFAVRSNAGTEGRFDPAQYAAACRGTDVSPQLAWRQPPAGTLSYAVTVFDRDARGGKGFWHWVAYDIPASVTALPAGAAVQMPAGARQAVNDYGGHGYGGPCPPAGELHHYTMSVAALDIARLPVEDGATAAEVAAAVGTHTLAKAELVLMARRP